MIALTGACKAPVFMWHSQVSHKKAGEETHNTANDTTDGDLQRRVPHELLELLHGIDRLKLIALLEPLLYDFIEDLGLFTCFAADTHGIIHDDKGEKDCHGQFKTVCAIDDCGRDDEGTDCGGVGARHASGAEYSVATDFSVDDEFDDELQRLCGKPPDGGGDE